MSRVTLKSSTIFISSGGKTRVYRSVQEVPPSLRRKLEQSTNGLNSATILIADRKGREEIVRALRGLPSEVRPRLTPEEGEALARGSWRTRFAFLFTAARCWRELLLPFAIGASVWLLARFL